MTPSRRALGAARGLVCLLAALVASCDRAPDVPALPQVELSGYTPEVREQILSTIVIVYRAQANARYAALLLAMLGQGEHEIPDRIDAILFVLLPVARIADLARPA